MNPSHTALATLVSNDMLVQLGICLHPHSSFKCPETGELDTTVPKVTGARSRMPHSPTPQDNQTLNFTLKTKILQKVTHVHCRKFEIYRKAKSGKYNLKSYHPVITTTNTLTSSTYLCRYFIKSPVGLRWWRSG